VSSFSDEDRAREWLLDIVEYAERIEGYLHERSLDEFKSETMIRDAVERCILVITEAAVRLGSERMAKLAPDVPLHALRAMGNILRHGYDRTNARLTWETATRDIPALRAACVEALERGG